MDLKKNQTHVTLCQTTDTDTEKTYEPNVIGSWHLQNREQIKKRKHEAQKKQMLQWHLEEQKIHKRQRSQSKIMGEGQCCYIPFETVSRVSKLLYRSSHFLITGMLQRRLEYYLWENMNTFHYMYNISYYL